MIREAEIAPAFRRIPILATLIVIAAVLAMVWLGFWQLRRADEKAVLLAQLRENPTKPPAAFPVGGPVPDSLLFRRSTVICPAVVRWSVEAGSAADGTTGYRAIAHCSGAPGTAGPLVIVGVAGRPDFRPEWKGGVVSGWITRAPDRRPLIARFAEAAVVLPPVLIAADAPAGLKPAAPPRIADVPNNHSGYAVQWFAFAAIALVIYALALARRLRTGAGDS